VTVRAVRDEVFYDVARSVCATCLARVEARVVFRDGGVWLEKWCPTHGRERVLVADDVDYWRQARELWLKPAELPARFAAPMRWGCPWDCGLCPDHQQHTCLAIVEVTDACNLTCPVCYAASGPHRPGFRSLEDVEARLDAVVRAEGAPDVVQISGGEPTLHPELFAILDAARRRPIRHLMLNTNGVRIAKEDGFAERLASYLPGFEVYLQWDSLRDDVLLRLRGARLADVRRRALERLEAAGVSTTLVVTVARGVNDDELGAIVDEALRWRCVRGVTLQPIQQAGRVDGVGTPERLTLTEVRRKLLAQTSLFGPDDVVPVPCHPDALAMAYALKLGDRVVPLTGLIGRDVLLRGPESTIVFERTPGARAAVDAVLSTGLGPVGQAEKLGELLCCLPRVDVGNLGYEQVFRVLIVRFADAHDLDVRALKKSCIAFAQPDGRMIPFETFNLFYRDTADGALARGRARAEAGG
jgi:uncharacterized radical SAM superfamily Fe-S cluster-containing enzyme